MWPCLLSVLHLFEVPQVHCKARTPSSNKPCAGGPMPHSCVDTHGSSLREPNSYYLHTQVARLLAAVVAATPTLAAKAVAVMLTHLIRRGPAHQSQRCQMPSHHTRKLCWWGGQQVALGWSSTQSRQGSCWGVTQVVACSYGMWQPLAAATAAVAAEAAAAVDRQPGCSLCR